MADGTNQALAALFGAGLISGAGDSQNADLTQMYNTLKSNNPYMQAAAPVLGAQFNTSTWSPGTTLGVTAAQAFLGNLLKGYGAIDSSQQLDKVAASLPALYADPLGTATPEGVDPQVYSQLRTNTVARQQAGMAAAAAEERKAKEAAVLEGDKERERIRGKNEGWGIISGSKGSGPALIDPDSPQGKAEKQRQELEQKYTNELLTGKGAERVLQVNTAAQSIVDALKQDSPIAATTAIYKFAKTLDPVGAVRNEDQKMVADPGGPLGQLAMIHNEILQKGKLTPEAKTAMKEVLPSLLGAEFNSYNQVKDNLLTAAKEYGANPERVKYLQPFDIKTALLPSPQEFAAAAKARGLTREQANAEWLAMGGK